MATAQREGGLYYTDKGQPVDAEGKPVKDAPKIGPDTDPSKQPGALGAQAADPLHRLAAILEGKSAPAVKGSGASGKAAAEDEADELPTVDELDSHLASMTTVEEVRALKRRDKRVTAAPKYEARIAELKAQE
jgi:hypothetical protein